MQIPFVGGAYKNRSISINAQECVNLFVVTDKNDANSAVSLINTPGCKEFCTVVANTINRPIRGLHVYNNFIYAVLYDGVYKISQSGIVTYIGALTTITGNVWISDNGTQLLIVDGTQYGAYVSNADVLTIITLPCIASSVAFMDGYFIISEKGTGNFFISGLYDITAWDVLDFANAESDADKIECIVTATQTIWILGSKTTEIFQNTGAASFPFERVQGAVFKTGTLASKSACVVGEQIYWLSDKRQIVRSVGYQYEIVSTPHLDYLFGTLSRVDDAIAFSYVLDGYYFYVITFPTAKKTFQLNVTTSFWNELQSYNTEDEATPWSRHRSNCGVMFNNKAIIGDYMNGKLYELDMKTFTDNLELIRRSRAASTIAKERHMLTFNSFELELEPGTGLDGIAQGISPKICLDWSNDGGFTWSNEHWETFGVMGKYADRVKWNRLGQGRNRVFRISITDPVKVVILGAFADIEESIV